MRISIFSVIMLAGSLMPGCNNRSPTSPEQNSGVTVSLPSPARTERDQTAEVVDASDDIVIQLRSIQDLRSHTLPENADDAREMDRQRQLRIIEIATEIAAACANNEQRKDQFTQAIAERLESRFQLAMTGADSDVRQLYGDVQSLTEADPKGAASAEGIYTLARFAHAMARQNGTTDLRWFENFSRWSREFASRFPQQKKRAIALLSGAAQSCELHAMVVEQPSSATRLLTEARLCHKSLAETFSESREAEDSVATLRRLALVGQPLSQFGGPLLNGQFLDSEAFRGTLTVIYFWETESEEFRDQLLPLLKQARSAAGDLIRFVGINLNTDIRTVENFAATENVPGHQIFFREENQNGWNNPLVRFWGVKRTPTVWIIDRDGKVAAVDITSRRLVEEIKRVFQNAR